MSEFIPITSSLSFSFATISSTLWPTTTLTSTRVYSCSIWRRFAVLGLTLGVVYNTYNIIYICQEGGEGGRALTGKLSWRLGPPPPPTDCLLPPSPPLLLPQATGPGPIAQLLPALPTWLSRSKSTKEEGVENAVTKKEKLHLKILLFKLTMQKGNPSPTIP